MTAASELRAAATKLRTLAGAATPGPWRDSAVDNNRYAALVSDVMPEGRPVGKGWDWDDGYGGYLIGESLQRQDRAFIAAMHPGVALSLAGLLSEVATTWESQSGPDLEKRAGTSPLLPIARAINGATS